MRNKTGDTLWRRVRLAKIAETALVMQGKGWTPQDLRELFWLLATFMDSEGAFSQTSKGMWSMVDALEPPNQT